MGVVDWLASYTHSDNRLRLNDVERSMPMAPIRSTAIN
jgi:hypothetical protein